jgi:hypothetical protein
MESGIALSDFHICIGQLETSDPGDEDLCIWQIIYYTYQFSTIDLNSARKSANRQIVLNCLESVLLKV